MLHDIGVSNVDKATSDDGEGARNIDRLKGRCPPAKRLQGIVTVGMAYEGLDCPEITHIACLTRCGRQNGWKRMLARPASIAARESGRRPHIIRQLSAVLAPPTFVAIETAPCSRRPGGESRRALLDPRPLRYRRR